MCTFLWFYKHQHDNRVRSKLFVACQRWWFRWRFWFVPSVPGYMREEEEHKPDPWRNTIERNHKKSQVYFLRQFVKTPKIISNKTLFAVYKWSLLCRTIKYTGMCVLIVDDSILKAEHTYEVNKSKDFRYSKIFIIDLWAPLVLTPLLRGRCDTWLYVWEESQYI